MFVFMRKQREVKAALKQFHKNNYSGLPQRIQNAYTEVENVQRALANDMFYPELVAREKELLGEYKHLLQADLSLAAQRSKVTWLQEMDSNCNDPKIDRKSVV